MAKRFEAIKKYYSFNNKKFLFLTILFVIGVIAGTIFSLTLSDVDNKVVVEFLTKYVDIIRKGTLVFKDSFFNYLISMSIVVLIIWLLGYSVIGIPIIIFMYFYKCFSLGFCITSILSFYKFKGLIFAFIYVFPHQIVYLFLLIILIIYAYSISINIIEAIIYKKDISFKDISRKYFIILAIAIVIIILLSLYQSSLLPTLVKLVFLKA